jgi:hypothetical protein
MPFKKGQSGNPKGRKPREVEKDYLARLRACVTPPDWNAIIDRAVVDAKRGDTAARKFLADYLIGVPVQKIEATGKNGEPIEIIEVMRESISQPDK